MKVIETSRVFGLCGRCAGCVTCDSREGGKAGKMEGSGALRALNASMGREGLLAK